MFTLHCRASWFESIWVKNVPYTWTCSAELEKRCLTEIIIKHVLKTKVFISLQYLAMQEHSAFSLQNYWVHIYHAKNPWQKRIHLSLFTYYRTAYLYFYQETLNGFYILCFFNKSLNAFQIKIRCLYASFGKSKKFY